MSYKNFNFETDLDGIALVTWDMPGKSMNVIDESVIEELAASRTSERQGRVIDRDAGASMERKKQEGYF